MDCETTGRFISDFGLVLVFVVVIQIYSARPFLLRLGIIEHILMQLLVLGKT